MRVRVWKRRWIIQFWTCDEDFGSRQRTSWSTNTWTFASNWLFVDTQWRCISKFGVFNDGVRIVFNDEYCSSMANDKPNVGKPRGWCNSKSIEPAFPMCPMAISIDSVSRRNDKTHIKFKSKALIMCCLEKKKTMRSKQTTFEILYKRQSLLMAGNRFYKPLERNWGGAQRKSFMTWKV